ncbi:MAG: cation:proton antiporter [Anaerolineae bacterium]|nr:cation:proton antiporter [Anaerolineae bacterium]
MQHDLILFATITMAILTAFVGGFVARKLKLPTLVGYLVAGVVIGPFTPGFVGDTDSISQLAEIGVIFMMFGVGLHFSLKDLWSVRKIALPGATLQTIGATLLGFGLAQIWGWSVSAGLVLGLALSIASTIVLLRGLTDNGLLNTSHGRVAIGWLVLEDIATVIILVMMPALVGHSGNLLEGLVLALLKTGVFIAIMLFIGVRFMPWLITKIARTRSRELFLLVIITMALGTSFIAAELFGVSLALAAFLAGVVLGESRIHHQVAAEIGPFRDVFAVLFFVSVGMLVNPIEVLNNFGQVLVITLLIVVGKSIFTLLLGIVLPGSGMTMLVVAAGLSQIGEFSFIVGQTGVGLGIIAMDQYGLILAASVISIILNPLMFKTIDPAATFIKKYLPWLWRQLEHGKPLPEPMHESMKDHVVIVGYGRVGRHVGRVLDELKLPYLVVENDSESAFALQQAGTNILLGDAANSEILTHAGLKDARALVITLPDETTAELTAAAAHDIAPDLPIIARAITEDGVQMLAEYGALHIIHPELEGGLEIVRHTLLTLGYPMGQIQNYVDAMRTDAYRATYPDYKDHRVFDQLVSAVRGLEIGWFPVSEHSPVIGQTLAEANLRARIGASIIATVRDHAVLPNPKSDTRFLVGDMVGLIGSISELAEAEEILNPTNPHA